MSPILIITLISGIIFTNSLSAFAQSGSEQNKLMVQLSESNEEFVEEVKTIPDPLKSYNRAIYNFNDKFYFYLLKPAARGYKAVLPEKVRVSIRNFISNTAMPVRFINCLLQGRVKSSATELTRFTINTTWGVAGLFDPAKFRLNLKGQDEDFGQTLGCYGLKEGFFIIWPFLGPSNLRDTIGIVADYFSDPVIYVEPLIRAGINDLDKVNKTSLTLGEYEELKESAMDPYFALRNAYFEHRRYMIKK